MVGAGPVVAQGPRADLLSANATLVGGNDMAVLDRALRKTGMEPTRTGRPAGDTTSAPIGVPRLIRVELRKMSDTRSRFWSCDRTLAADRQRQSNECESRCGDPTHSSALSRMARRVRTALGKRRVRCGRSGPGSGGV